MVRSIEPVTTAIPPSTNPVLATQQLVIADGSRQTITVTTWLLVLPRRRSPRRRPTRLQYGDLVLQLRLLFGREPQFVDHLDGHLTVLTPVLACRDQGNKYMRGKSTTFNNMLGEDSPLFQEYYSVHKTALSRDLYVTDDNELIANTIPSLSVTLLLLSGNITCGNK